MPKPTEEMWLKNAERFKQNGKHIINIQCPVKAGSLYYNYKEQHPVVLLALVDADYKFIAVEVGSYGRNSDGGIFNKSNIGTMLENNLLHVPGKSPLEPNGEPLPHVILGDEAFPLKSYLHHPFSKKALRGNEHNKMFNYRLSRARRVVENLFWNSRRLLDSIPKIFRSAT
ncbi:hypothetical protein NQ317_005149 [Molorchus minor]|uniref:DDE Tnp4 domain-containing protein n=1 Tax=Molorchus minor TaxID=1323400 RepID=A0ABQ9J006_9CUCU|nr:hypothetical protein NQ317_005149 [Molorchus minor]